MSIRLSFRVREQNKPANFASTLRPVLSALKSSCDTRTAVKPVTTCPFTDTENPEGSKVKSVKSKNRVLGQSHILVRSIYSDTTSPMELRQKTSPGKVGIWGGKWRGGEQ